MSRGGALLLAGLAGLGVILMSESESAGKEADTEPGALAARDMTRAQAKAELERLAALGVVRIQTWHPDGRVTIAGVIAGIDFRYIDAPRVVNQIDVRLGVFLARLALRLNAAHGVIIVRHFGIYPGDPARPMDCHNQGRAIDLAGFQGSEGDFRVARDWGSKPKRGPGYRLTAGDPGFAIFEDVYDFCAREASDTSPAAFGNVAPSRIGDPRPPSHLIITPDHSDPALAKAHADHMHVQIGPT